MLSRAQLRHGLLAYIGSHFLICPINYRYVQHVCDLKLDSRLGNHTRGGLEGSVSANNCNVGVDSVGVGAICSRDSLAHCVSCCSSGSFCLMDFTGGIVLLLIDIRQQGGFVTFTFQNRSVNELG